MSQTPGRIVSAVWLLLGLCVAGGCSNSNHKSVPVSGRVTLYGKPLAGATIGFEPRSFPGEILAGPGSYGKTDADGRYELQMITGGRGGIVATHDVSIRTARGGMDAATGEPIELEPERVPPAYLANGALTMTVPAEGTDAADFKLVTKER